MELDSLSFLLFMSFTLVIFWKSPINWRKVILVLLSLWFYFSLSPQFGLTIFWSGSVAYISGLAINKLRKSNNNDQSKQVFFIATSAVLLLLATLGFFKYLSFWSETVASVIPPLELSNYLLPLGISFYTFQLIGYLVDVVKNKYNPETSLLNFSVFLLFFPKILAGPIERGDNLLPQIRELESWDFQRFISGCKLFILGLFKKKVIADNLVIVVDRVFDQLPEYKGLSLVLVMFFYAWYIYMDFSGYTDMARGVARTLGFNLLENFQQPYSATSIRNFWRKWHISLSNWFRDYVYFPLGGSRKGSFRTISNLLIVFVITGIWHGATINFLIWGAIHGVFISFERLTFQLLYSLSNKKISTKFHYLDRLKKLFFIGYSFSVVTASWVVFRAPTLSDAQYIYKNALVGLTNFINPTYVKATLELVFDYNYLEMSIAFLVLFFAICLEILSTYKPLNYYLNQMPGIVRYLLYLCVLSSIILFRQVESTEFVYVIF